MEKTATQVMNEYFEKNRSERDLHRYMCYFTEKWSPEDRRESAEFQADFVAVVQAIHSDAQRPLSDILAQALRASSVTTPFVPVKDSA